MQAKWGRTPNIESHSKRLSAKPGSAFTRWFPRRRATPPHQTLPRCIESASWSSCVVAMFSFVSFVAVRARRRRSSTRQIRYTEAEFDVEALLVDEETIE